MLATASTTQPIKKRGIDSAHQELHQLSEEPLSLALRAPDRQFLPVLSPVSG